MVNRIVQNHISYQGEGSIVEVVPELIARGYSKAFICTGPKLRELGLVSKLTDLMDKAGFGYEIYDRVHSSPTIEDVQEGVKVYHESGADCMVSLGGGSCIDAGKAIGIIVNNATFADVRSLEGMSATTHPTVFTIAIPTTAGTGAEVSTYYIIKDTENKRQIVCMDANDIPEVVVLDADLMATMPENLTGITGMGSLAHAIEAYVSQGSSLFSDVFNIEAIRLINQYIRPAFRNEMSGREGMAMGEYSAGMGSANAGLGIIQSIANVISAHYGIAHSEICARVLPAGIEFNGKVAGRRFREIADAMGITAISGMSDDGILAVLVSYIRNLNHDMGIESSLKDILKEEDIKQMAMEVCFDPYIANNPRDVDPDSVEKLFRELMK